MLKGTVKLAYGDNRFEAQEYVSKDLHHLFGNCSALNKAGVSYEYDIDIVNEPEAGWPNGRYYAEIEFGIVGSSLAPEEMKDAIDKAMTDLDNYDHAFIYEYNLESSTHD